VLASLANGLGQRLFPDRWPGFRMALRRTIRPARLGTLGRTRPLSNDWGYERGNPIDRYYIEAFLTEHRADIRGRVLEVKDSTYTSRYGAGVRTADVLDIDPSNPHATLIADLSAADSIDADQFDCFILTQTLQLILDPRAALRQTHRILRPGGVVLATVPVVSRIIPNRGLTTDYWRFTAASCQALFEEAFGPGQVLVRSYGNVTSAIAFLAGAVQEDLRPAQLNATDEYFPMVIAVRARKREGSPQG
jgi:SAM-dependent methyltransferase